MKNLSPSELRDLLDRQQATVLDVREPEEWDIVRLEGSVHVPMGEVAQRFDEIRHLKGLVVICHHGIRSARVGRFLEQQGLRDVAHLEGGLSAWADEIDPAMPRY